MDIQQIELVQSSFRAIANATDEFSLAFYDHLFASDGSVRAMFPADMQAQRKKLMDELTFIVGSLGQLSTLVARTTELGQTHVSYGVEPLHYDLVLEALLSAMQSTLGDAFSDDVIIAWRRAYHLVAETMLYGASHPHG